MAATLRVEVPTDLLIWARQRARLDYEDLAKFPLRKWERGEQRPTLRQLEGFAEATHTPIGYFFLQEPPEENVPLPDFRTRGGARIDEPSPDLLETIFQCQERQDWYRDYVQITGDEPRAPIGNFTLSDSPSRAVAALREAIGFDVGERGRGAGEAFTKLSEAVEAVGILVMVNGVVGSNTHRKLDPDEFGGFALFDPLAPVVFVNNADTKAAQIFTLVHEVAHLWLGQSALDDVAMDQSGRDAEYWCNEVAAEFLVPADRLRASYEGLNDLTSELEKLSAIFRVSTLVCLRRIHETQLASWSREEYRAIYNSERQRVMDLRGAGGDGGNYYYTQPVRVSKRFARAVITSTLEGRTLYGDAFRMVGARSTETFQKLAEHLGVE